MSILSLTCFYKFASISSSHRLIQLCLNSILNQPFQFFFKLILYLFLLLPFFNFSYIFERIPLFLKYIQINGRILGFPLWIHNISQILQIIIDILLIDHRILLVNLRLIKKTELPQINFNILDVLVVPEMLVHVIYEFLFNIDILKKGNDLSLVIYIIVIFIDHPYFYSLDVIIIE